MLSSPTASSSSLQIVARPLARFNSTATRTAGTSVRARTSKRLSVQPGADLVGPPDPTSNLRPVIYGSAFEEVAGQSRADERDAWMSRTVAPSSFTVQQPPFQSLSSSPYSTSEFTLSSSSAAAKGGWSGNPVAPTSAYYLSLLDRLEVAELDHHLRRSRSDRFSQAFWADNNRRYTEALSKYQYEHLPPSFKHGADRPRQEGDGAVAREGRSDTASLSSSPPSSSSRSAAATSRKPSAYSSKAPNNPSQDLLAPFYAAWLSANSARHRAYNRQLWQMTREDLGPALRYAALKRYVKLVRWYNVNIWPRQR
ncbi:unnamed protein product [Parajaminaea phylloscopi]